MRAPTGARFRRSSEGGERREEVLQAAPEQGPPQPDPGVRLVATWPPERGAFFIWLFSERQRTERAEKRDRERRLVPVFPNFNVPWRLTSENPGPKFSQVLEYLEVQRISSPSHQIMELGSITVLGEDERKERAEMLCPGHFRNFPVTRK